MTKDQIEALAHRECWRYKKSSDPHHSDTYTFNTVTLHQFARKLVDADRSEPNCKTCANRGQIYGLSQETYCEGCIYQQQWRADRYTPNAEVSGGL